MQKIRRLVKKGDTLIEVIFAITVFSLISVLALQIMNKDLAMIQGALEAEMARNEIDAQAEALRFIQNAFLSERELAVNKREYQDLWMYLSRGTDVRVSNAGAGLANLPQDISQYPSLDCKDFYGDKSGDIHNIYSDSAFIINTRKIDPKKPADTIISSRFQKDLFHSTELYPRVIFQKKSGGETNDSTTLSEGGSSAVQDNKTYDVVARAEGIWVISVRDYTEGKNNVNTTPEFFDFHIRTCWMAPGHERPSTIGTTIRLYNPEFVEARSKNGNE